MRRRHGRWRPGVVDGPFCLHGWPRNKLRGGTAKIQIHAPINGPDAPSSPSPREGRGLSRGEGLHGVSCRLGSEWRESEDSHSIRHWYAGQMRAVPGGPLTAAETATLPQAGEWISTARPRWFRES